MTTNSELLIDGNRGIYVGKQFAQHIAPYYMTNREKYSEDLAILEEGPEHGHYDDAWANVLDNARITSDSGKEFVLWQDGDLWAVPVDELDQLDEF